MWPVMPDTPNILRLHNNEMYRDTENDHLQPRNYVPRNGQFKLLFLAIKSPKVENTSILWAL